MTRTAKKGMAALIVGAIGVVFGDIGTSPLYAIQALFSPLGHHLQPSVLNVHGVISLIFWSVTLVVSVKYIGFITRVSNKGEGGIMALVALIQNGQGLRGRKTFLIGLGLVGVSLFYGDSIITPAISVLSAVEGLRVVTPQLANVVIPMTIAVLCLLFWVQRFGTQVIGKMFGPIMIVWFVTIGLGGAWQIVQHPDILQALSPMAAVRFFAEQPLIAFVAMSAVTLAITGAEALYADMGHFGRAPIARAWFILVFPALMLCYAGQGALILTHPGSAGSSFILLFPEVVRFTVVVLATLATLIASQSVISGAYSLTCQAIQLGFLPKMQILHTSARRVGQVYLPFINMVLFVGVIFLVLVFRSSTSLANAYGLAVSGTLAVDSILFLTVLRTVYKRHIIVIILGVIGFLSVDLLFVSSNISKVVSGGWFPVMIALLVLVTVVTWNQGQRIVSHKRHALEGSLDDFVVKVRQMGSRLTRVPGSAIYISHHAGLAPLALHATLDELHELHEHTVVVSVEVLDVPHVPETQRVRYDGLTYHDGISHLHVSYGFHDVPNVPQTLASVSGAQEELDFDLTSASYFVSLSKVVPTGNHAMALWRKVLYCAMARNASSPSDYYKLPIERTIEIRTLIEI